MDSLDKMGGVRMKKLVILGTIWLISCVSLPDLGDSYTNKSFHALSAQQSRLIIYLDVPLTSSYYRVEIDENPWAYLIPNSFQEIVVDAGIHSLSIPDYYYGGSVILGMDASDWGGFLSSDAMQFHALPATTHYFRYELHREQRVIECDESRDTISVCNRYVDVASLIEVTEEEALRQISNYREALNEEL